ncbi:DUF7261 family protein [Halocatena salina]|uniref:Uncharacterized protein n=1 Tax=Halocatena salina TaxID=2934340 RepID=A0A8U0A3H0_9EURY|nr:hypothetical protein [Halocatena salina]UPM43584.1 hypothetical protein MW046_03835 [Halocatena salina]
MNDDRPLTPLETDRGQLVLVAAVFIAVSFVPITVAYLQLGYSADVKASSDTPVESLESTVQRLEHVIYTETNGTTAWSHRNHTVTELHTRLEPHASAIETEHITHSVRIEYNESAASEWALTNCPNGSARQFGPCTADRGVVVQERIGEAHLLAVAFDMTLKNDRERIEATMIIGPTDRPIKHRSANVTPTPRRSAPHTREVPRQTEQTETIPGEK